MRSFSNKRKSGSGILGAIIIIIGGLFGIWLGGWVCFVGGIVQVVESVKADPVSSIGIGVGALRVVCASVVGWATIVVTTFIGVQVSK